MCWSSYLCYVKKNEFKHDVKINLALDDLPDTCKILRNAPYDPQIFGYKSKIFDTEDTELSWDLRLNILSINISNSGNVINPQVIDSDKLKIAIETFKTEQLDR